MSHAFTKIMVQQAGAEVVPIITVHKDDHRREGVWSHAPGGNLYFNDRPYENAALSNGNGAVAGAAQGNPVQLIYWGSWWASQQGMARRVYIDSAMQGLLLSPYFEELKQYGVVHAPVWRGDSLPATDSEPDVHQQGDRSKDFNRACKELISDLMDDGRLPAASDDTHICFLVLMPPGFAPTNADGSHSNDYEWDFPFDVDTYWVGWARHDADRNHVTKILSHELVEMLTDPAADAWRWDPEPADGITEISDAREPLTAWVGSTFVQAYWSQRHLANLIPLNNDYGARLSASIKETARRIAHSGTFRARPEDSAACTPNLQDCCFDDRTFEFRIYGMDEIARVRLHTRRFIRPKTSWQINGVAVNGEGDLNLTVEVQSFTAARDPLLEIRTVTVHYKIVELNLVSGDPEAPPPFEMISSGLDISAGSIAGNFEIDVSCTVTETAIGGSPVNPPVAFPKLTVDFVCTEILLEDTYIEQLSRCYASMLKRYVALHLPTGRPGPGEPINAVSQLLKQVTLPAYVRSTRRNALEEATRLARAAGTMFERPIADRFVRSLLARTPELKLATLLRQKPSLPRRQKPAKKGR